MNTLEIFTLAFTILHLLDFLIKSIPILRAKVETDENKTKHGFSVVICAHNELKNLKKNLQYILQQEYPYFEILLVLDRSDDGSYEYLEPIFQSNSKLKVISINKVPEGYHPKKYAITKAIEFAENEWILLTDADCRPASTYWINSFNNLIEEHVSCILGISPYQPFASGLLNSFISYESFKTALYYISATLDKRPYMAVGRNLAYRKDAFLTADGFGEFATITGGDDDLLIQRVATKNNCIINMDKRSFTISEPKRSWMSYLKQKTRHLSVGKHYKPSIKTQLFLSNGIHCTMWLSNIILFSFNPNHGLITVALALVITVKGLVSRALSYRLSMRWFLPLFPLMDLMYALGLPMIGLRSILIKRVRWN